jgi:hypothetical protein
VTKENLARVVDPSRVAPGGHTGFDASYAVSLGDDAVPDLVAALVFLDGVDRGIVARDLLRRRDELGDDAGSRGWMSWNLARERARESLDSLEAVTGR